MKNIFKSISATLKISALVLLTMTGLQNLTAQVVCHTPGTISVNLGASGEHLVDGTEVVISTNGATITDVTLRLDGMNGPITPNPVTCGLLLGGPRTIWVMVETDDGNNCMTSFTLQDKLGPVLECPTVLLTCAQDFSVAPDATATDNCSDAGNITLSMTTTLQTTINGFDGAFNPASFTTDESAAQGESVEVNGLGTELIIAGNNVGPVMVPSPCNPDIDGLGCDVVNVCVTIPVTGTVNFDWLNEPGPGSTGFFPAGDPSGFSVNSNYTTLSDGATTSGSEAVPVNTGDEFCFAIGSNGGPAYSQSVFSNLVYNYAAASTCDEDYIIKRWTATDEYGNSSECRQFIVKEITDDITCPDSLLTSLGTAISCEDFDMTSFQKDDNGHPHVNETGAPVGCNINYTYADIVIEGCMAPNVGGCRKINRTFHIVNSCTGEKTTCVQQIQIEDIDGPTVAGLEDNFVVPTDATECIASYTVPVPTITDNCSDVGDYTVAPSRGTVSFNGTNFVISDLTPGPFSYTVQVRDCCGNLTTEEYDGDVQDLAPPTPVCETFRDISLTTDGTGRIFAESFDDGSHDNCNPVFFKVLRMDETGCAAQNGDDDLGKAGTQIYFDDDVFFCCEDVAGGQVQVIFRVFDVNPGNGPVVPARMESGGDLFGRYNDCMVTVNVFDKVAPTISCPTDVTVSCEFWFDINDLSTTFGTVVGAPTAPATTTTMDPGTGMNIVVTDGVASGNCVLDPQEIDVQDLRNSCGLGLILRTFSVGNGPQARNCTQIITVEDATPFNESNIGWPLAEINFTDCMAATDTSVTGVPTITGDGVCAQISVTFVDEDFPVEPNSCFKVKRTWKVKDICQHNASDPDQGVWTFDQIISVKNNMDPTFASCDPINAACGGTVDLTQTVNDDCTPLASLRVDFKIDLDNDGTYEYVGGNNNPTPGAGMSLASSTYDPATGIITIDPLALPTGTHRILWAAEDLCSNVGTCTQLITTGVDNMAPELDIDGILVSNAANTVSGMITAIDDCVAEADINYISYEIVLGGTLTSVDPLTGLGNTITLINYVGSGDVTINFLVSDGTNMATLTVVNAVAAPPAAMISGAISTDDGEMVEAVHVDAGIGQTEMTDENGSFEFSPLEANQDYSVAPTKDDDPRNGISTLDLILIARHIIGLQPISTPEKLIAADVTGDKRINTFDMVELQQLLIWNIPTFIENSSWRFIDAEFIFPNPANPFEIDFPETYDINGLSGNMMGVDFTGIKIGDINGDVVANAHQEAEERNIEDTYTINVVNQNVNGNATIEFLASEATEINGIQMMLDLGQLELTAVEAGVLNIDAEQVTLVDGQYAITFANGTPLTVAADEVLFTLEVIADRATTVAEELVLENAALNAEVYTGANEVKINNAAIQVMDVNPISDELYQNRPNPFTQNTTIGFYLVHEGAVSLTIYDVSGKLIYAVEGNYNAGFNQIDLSAADFSAEGVLYYQLATDNFTASRRMTIVK